MARLARNLFATWLLACLAGTVLGEGPEVRAPLGDVNVEFGAPDTAIALQQHFADPNYPGTTVRFSTVLGDILVELYDDVAPLTVANFLNYVNDGDYESSIFHRLVHGFVLQGGGYYYPGWGPIPADPPVVNEFSISNTRGTLAMAKLAGDPDSATSQWFFNLDDNSATLDVDNGGYTVFGHVILGGMTVVDALAAIPTYDFGFDPWRELPLMNYAGPPTDIVPENVVMVHNITLSSPLTFEVTGNDNPAIVTATVSDAQLTLHYTGGGRGVANITVRATDEGGLWVEDTFAVTIEGRPRANADQALTNMGEPVSIAVLANDTGNGATIDPDTLTIVADPANGAADIDPLTHEIVYTPNPDFRGTDTFIYQVSDDVGMTSDPATVTVWVNGPPVVTQPLDDVKVDVNSPPTVIPLGDHFADPDNPGTTVRFSTVLGDILVELYDDAAPLTVANFLNYVNRGDYDSSIFHRLVPGFVLQGGGYWYPGWWDIPTDPPVPNEFGISNTRGTIAMAKQPGDPNSATSQWFFNLADNSATLDVDNGGYTVFGRVIGDGMAVVDALAAIPTYDFGWDPWRELPLINYTGFPNEEPGPDNVVMVYEVAISSPLAFSVTNDNPDLLTATVSGSRLTLEYLTDQRGTANITVRATDEFGLWVEDSFTVEVKLPPTARNDSLTVQENEQTDIAVLANDLAGDDAINPTTVTIVTPPAHGTAIPNPLTGAVTYTPEADYYGADSFTYKVSDAGGWWSNVATVSIIVNAAPILLEPIPDMEVDIDASPARIDLSLVFTDIEIRGHIARFNTTLGTFDVELLDAQAPNTVANFRRYVDRGRYTSTLIHRVVPGFVVQGGGYHYPTWEHIPEDPPIANEFGASNVRGTLAMAKLDGNPDSATSEWFFNLADNSENLDHQNGGFTVFGRVLGNGMDVVDSIAAVPTYPFNSPYDQLPLRDYASFPEEPGPENVILVHGITIRTPLTYTIILDTPGQLILNPTIDGNTLVLNMNPNQWGTGTVTIRATDEGGASVETTFQVTAIGAPLANDDAPVADPGVPLDIPVLLNDVARGRPIDPATVTIVQPPEYGAVDVDPVTGVVTYTPPAAFVGPDPFTYTVRDADGRRSNTATVDLVVGSPGFLVGTGYPGSLRYTDPDGTIVTIAVKTGVARVCLRGFVQLLSPGPTQIVVGGTQVSLYRIEMLQSSATTAVTFTTSGGAIPGATLGEFAGAAPLGTLSAANIDLVGKGIVMTGAGYIATATLRDVRNGADILMPGTGAPKGLTLTVRDIPDPGTDIRTGSHFSKLTMARWVGSSLNAPAISTLAVTGNTSIAVPGDFGANLTLTSVIPGQANTLYSAKIAGNITGGTWVIANGVGTITAGSSAPGWTLTAGGAVSSLTAATDLAGTLTAVSFGTIKATRELTATITATNANAALASIGTLSAAKVNAATVNATGGITTVSVSEWNGGALNAAWIASLITTKNSSLNLSGNLTNLALTLSGAGSRPQTLAKAAVVGKVSGGTLFIGGHGGALSLAMLEQADVLVAGNLASLAFVYATDSSLVAQGRITTLSGTQWAGGGVQAAALSSLTIKGDALLQGSFTGGLVLTGQGVAAGQTTLGTVNVSYAIAYADWDVTGSVGSITTYIAQDWTLKATGAIQALTLNYATRANVTANGIISRVTTLQWAGGKLEAATLPSLNLGNVGNLNVTATNNITTATALAWVGGSITAKYFGTITIINKLGYADFSPDITLTGAAGVTNPFGTLKVGRRILGGTWNITGNIGTVDVFSFVENCTIRVTGNIGTFAIGGIVNSKVYAGVDPSLTALPSAPEHFVSTTSTIQTFTVRGIPTEVSQYSYVNSNIAAPIINSASLVNVMVDNATYGHARFGVAGRTIRSLSWKQTNTSYSWPTRWPVYTTDFAVVLIP